MSTRSSGTGSLLRFDQAACRPESGRALGWLERSFWGHVDLPRIREAQIAGAVWVITTNPLRGATGRPRALARNAAALAQIFESVPSEVTLVRNGAQYRAARALGTHAAFVGVQGGNALGPKLEALDLLPRDLVLLVTLVHLSSSGIGATSSPLGWGATRD